MVGELIVGTDYLNRIRDRVLYTAPVYFPQSKVVKQINIVASGSTGYKWHSESAFLYPIGYSFTRGLW